MTSEQTSEGTLIIRVGEDEYYAIPQAVLAQGRLPAERTSELDAQLTAGEVTGFQESVLLPWKDAHYYALPPEVIEQHRVPAGRVPEAQALLSVSADDTTGFRNWGYQTCPRCGVVSSGWSRALGGPHQCAWMYQTHTPSPTVQAPSVTFSAALTPVRFP